MKFKSGVGGLTQKEDHFDHRKNCEFFENEYVNKKVQKNEYVSMYLNSDKFLAWFSYQGPHSPWTTNKAYPITTHQDHYDFIKECKNQFLSINDWAWKQMEEINKLKKAI